MNATFRRIPMLILSASLGAAAVAATPRTAHALQGGEDPALLPVLIDKRFGNGSRHQLGLMVSTAMATKFVEGTGGYLTYGYNFTDLFGIEVGGGFIAGSETSIMEQVRLNFPGQEPPLSDLYQQQWMGLANFVVTPFYGKMSFASMLDPAYDLFVLVGAGAGGVRRKQDTGFDSKVSLMLDFGVGLRVYFTKLIALRLEFRNYLYPEPDATKSGFTSNLHFQGGVQFAFGGDE